MKFEDVRIGMMLSMTDHLKRDPKISEKRFFLIKSKTNDVIEALSILEGQHSVTFAYAEPDKKQWEDDRLIYSMLEPISNLREVFLLVFDDNLTKHWTED